MTAFKGPQRWKDKILDGDNIWSQVKSLLATGDVELPQTARRPDVRLILDNITGNDQIFRNPANHANDKSEHIPGTGDKCAAMVMVAGDTLDEQYKNARLLFEKFNLGEKGLSAAFLAAINADRAGGLVAEAYGPAPFAGQSSKLVAVDWHNADKSASHIAPVFGSAGALGARAATTESAIHVVVPVYVRGTGTTPEMIQSSGMVIAIAKDWQTGAETTRPIVASVAREFYGENFAKIPEVVVHPDGLVRSINLKNGTPVIDLFANTGSSAGAKPKMG